MNIKTALKHKKKLASKINEEFNKMSKYNSVESGANRVYSARESMSNWKELTNELIGLKTKIHLANAKVYGKIFRMSELKSQLSSLKGLDCTEGKFSDRYGMRDTPIVKEAEIGLLERDQMIMDMELEIEKLQEELDEHNATTTI
jgi:hypothetical protein